MRVFQQNHLFSLTLVILRSYDTDNPRAAMPSRVDHDLPCRAARAFLEEAGWFSVEAGSNWAFGVDVRTPLWI